MSAPRPARNLNDYVGIHTRVEKFRQEHAKARLVTQILEREPLTVRAEVYLEDNESTIPNAVGHASVEGGMGNREGSAVEKTESAAVGRALAFLGYEVKEGIASREEVQRATEREPSNPAGRLDSDILAAREILGKSYDDLTKAIKTKFGGDEAWHVRPVEQKEWLLVFLNNKVNEKAGEVK